MPISPLPTAPRVPPPYVSLEGPFPLPVRVVAISSIVLFVLWPKFILVPGLGLNPFVASQIALVLIAIIFVALRTNKTDYKQFSVSVITAFFAIVSFEFISVYFGGNDVNWRSYFRQLVGIKMMFLVGLIAGADSRTRHHSMLALTLALTVNFAIASAEQFSKDSALSIMSSFFAIDSNAVIDQMTSTKTRDGNFRSTGLFDHPIVLAISSSVGIALAGAIIFARTGLWRTLGWVLLALAVVTGYFSYSRTFLVGSMTAAAAYVAFSQVTAVRRGQWPLVVGAGLLLLGLAAFAIPSVLDMIQGRTSLEAQSSTLRDIMWQKGVTYIAERPLLGWGWGSDVVYAGLKQFGIVTIDDSYLSLLINNGVVGLLLLSVFCLATLRRGVEIINNGERALSGHAIFASCAIVVVVVCQKSNSIPFAFGFLYMAAGYIAAMRSRPMFYGPKR